MEGKESQYDTPASEPVFAPIINAFYRYAFS